MFQCDQCVQCCRNLQRSELYKDLHDGSGVCRYLKGNLYSIYEQRPLLCRVDACYQVFFKDLMSYEDYLQRNYESCRELKKLRGK